jgi:hypothetical protein
MEISPDLLERLRAIGLRLDKRGAFWHAGTQVTHPRLAMALLSWLDVRDDGRDIIAIDDRRYAYVDVEDAHLRARAARWHDDRCFVRWDDDRELELEYATLRQADDHALYVRIGRLRGRIAGPAYHAVTERVVVDDDGRFAIEAAGQRWPIADAR